MGIHSFPRRSGTSEKGREKVSVSRNVRSGDGKTGGTIGTLFRGNRSRSASRSCPEKPGHPKGVPRMKAEGSSKAQMRKNHAPLGRRNARPAGRGRRQPTNRFAHGKKEKKLSTQGKKENRSVTSNGGLGTWFGGTAKETQGGNSRKSRDDEE